MPQNYRYAEYPFLGLVFGVIVFPDTQVATTTMALAAALGTNPDALHSAHNQHPENFNPLRLSTRQPNEISQLIRQHRERFMIRKLRPDMLLWTEEDMYMHCRYSRSSRADEFMKHNVRFLREWRIANVPLNSISEERFARLEEMCAQLTDTNKQLRERLDKVERLPPINGAASIKFSMN